MFQSFWIKMAIKAVQYFSSSDFVNDVKEIVVYYIDKDMVGYKKKEAAVKRLRSKGYDFSSWVVNAAIELVLGYFKLKYPNLFRK